MDENMSKKEAECSCCSSPENRRSSLQIVRSEVRMIAPTLGRQNLKVPDQCHDVSVGQGHGGPGLIPLIGAVGGSPATGTMRPKIAKFPMADDPSADDGTGRGRASRDHLLEAIGMQRGRQDLL